MALYGSAAEYGLHCLLHLVSPPGGAALSARDVAEFQGVSPSLVAKLFTKLQKAGLLRSEEGVQGGFRLAREPSKISVLEAVDAAEGRKALFDCKEVRANCAIFEGEPPAWATRGLCTIHATMRRAEAAMRAELAQISLADLAAQVHGKTPREFGVAAHGWFRERAGARRRHHNEDKS